ncbi:MAG: F0F1 ATP synthase subunit epsilon [Chloroflexi bacterium]|nr:F0F1 ATP synthase subunit epsilon [Chloroflexota bacterium]
MPFRLDIVTAERQVYSEDVDLVLAPGADGQLGILPRHAPLFTLLTAGPLVIRKGGEETEIALSGGFMEVARNRVTIMADAAEHAEEIDEARARAGMERARERLQHRVADMDLERAQAAMRRAVARLAVVERRRRRRGERGSRPGGATP